MLLLAMAEERGIAQYSVASCWIATGHHDQLLWQMLPAMQTIKNLVWPVATAIFATDSIIIIETKARTYKHWRYSYKIAHAKKVELEYLAVLWLCEGVWYSNWTFPISWTGILGTVYMMEGRMILLYWNKSIG
jgi:6-phosphogluconate dehydrogenase (decarboxylating)